MQRCVTLLINEAVRDGQGGEGGRLGLTCLSIDQDQRKYMTGQYILDKMLQPDKGETEDFVPALHHLATGSAKVTKKVCRNYLA